MSRSTLLAAVLPLALVLAACSDGVTTTPIPIYEGGPPPLFDGAAFDVSLDTTGDAQEAGDAPADVPGDGQPDGAKDAATDGKADGPHEAASSG